MAKFDIMPYQGTFQEARPYDVAAGAAASINPGEPVAVTLGASTVSAMATNKPVVGTDYLKGISSSTSTDTVAAAGKVRVIRLEPGQTWLIKPKVAATFDTQAEYDALVGDRVLIDLTGGSYTILAADGATYGCVIEPLDIAEHPGKVAISFRNGVSYLT
jgi:hypothetical protein